MRKLYQMVKVVVIAFLAMHFADHLKIEPNGPGPPDVPAAVQADDMGLSYFDSTTVRTTLVATDDPAIVSNECPNDLEMNVKRTLALTSTTTGGTYANESEVRAPTRGTRSGLSETLNTASDVTSSKWGGLLRKVTSTGSRTVPVA